MFAESGARVRVRLVTPHDVAEAVVTAIRKDKTEIVVAPIEQRVFGRVISAAPELLRAIDAGSLPESAIAADEGKR